MCFVFCFFYRMKTTWGVIRILPKFTTQNLAKFVATESQPRLSPNGKLSKTSPKINLCLCKAAFVVGWCPLARKGFLLRSQSGLVKTSRWVDSARKNHWHPLAVSALMSYESEALAIGNNPNHPIHVPDPLSMVLLSFGVFNQPNHSNHVLRLLFVWPIMELCSQPTSIRR